MLARLRRRRVFTTELRERRPVAEGTLEVSFERPAGFTFEAGQYIQVRLPKLLGRDPKGPSRVFSITSSPLDDERVSIAYRDTGSGFKQTLRKLPTGEEVMIEGPHGFYTLPRDASRPVIFVAGGIGITPFVSMLRFAAQTDRAVPRVTLLYANGNRKSAAYLEELDELARRSARLSLRNHFGIVDEATVRRSVGDLAASRWYVAGPPAMVDAIRGTLHSLGVDQRDVLFEEFVGYAS